MIKLILLQLAIVLVVNFSRAQEVAINEVMSSNITTLADSDDDYPDWIELFNYGDSSIALDSLFLSDDQSLLNKWQFPAKILRPGEFYLVFAGEGLYENAANFKINSGGETLYLSNLQQTIIDSIAVPTLPADVSFGRSPDGAAVWGYFRQPTPFSANDTPVLATLNFDLPLSSLPAGHYPGLINLEISSTKADTIYYTRDGSVPSTNSEIFAAELILNQTTVVRARSLIDGQLSERVMTKTFIIDGQSDLPIIAIAANPGDLWADSTGIYSNWENGREIPIHLEFFDEGIY